MKLLFFAVFLVTLIASRRSDQDLLRALEEALAKAAPLPTGFNPNLLPNVIDPLGLKTLPDAGKKEGLAEQERCPEGEILDEKCCEKGNIAYDWTIKVGSQFECCDHGTERVVGTDIWVCKQKSCSSINWSTNGRCGPNYGNFVCDGQIMLDDRSISRWCSHSDWCGDTKAHNAGRTEYDFPDRCNEDCTCAADKYPQGSVAGDIMCKFGPNCASGTNFANGCPANAQTCKKPASPYKQSTIGSCNGYRLEGYENIGSKTDCEAAAKALKLPYTTAITGNWRSNPNGCYTKIVDKIVGKLYFNDAGNADSKSTTRVSICEKISTEAEVAGQQETVILHRSQDDDSEDDKDGRLIEMINDMMGDNDDDEDDDQDRVVEEILENLVDQINNLKSKAEASTAPKPKKN